MPYTVIMPNGRRMGFYIRGMAELYARIHKGTLVKTSDLDIKLVA